MRIETIGNATLYLGDCIETMRSLPAGSVQTCVTSPPYFGLRDYGHAGQIGLEPTPDEFVAALVAVFREVRRVLRDDGTLWLNLGDSYAGGGGFSPNSPSNLAGSKQATHAGSIKGKIGTPAGLKPKDLIGIPWRVAFALQADGWYLRQDIIWHKPNPMPESVRDRCTKAHEYVFLLSKSPRYYFDHEAIKEPVAASTVSRLSQPTLSEQAGSARVPGKTNGNMKAVGDGESRNKRSVWTVTTKPFKGAHFATFPPDLIEPCILAGTSERGHCPVCGARWVREVERMQIDGEPASVSDDRKPLHTDTYSRHKMKIQGGQTLVTGYNLTTGWRPTCTCGADPVPDIVLDPFGGAGTTGLVATQAGRDAVLCEINPEYVEMARARIDAASLDACRRIEDAQRQCRLAV